MYGFFYDAVSVADYLVSNGCMVNDELESMWKELVIV